MPEAERTPEGPVRGARFGGLLEGRVGDRLALERSFRKLREEGPVEMTLEVEGPRFALYLSDEPVSPDKANPERMQFFLEGLRELVSAAEPDAPLDSTLRCTEYYAEELVETHIGLEEGEIAPVSRVRALADSDDLPPAAERAPEPILKERSRRLLLAAAAVMLFGLVAWQGRFIDRVFGAPAAELVGAEGPFGDLLTLTIEPGFGGYKLLLERGPGYPLTGADVTRLEGQAQSPLARAAIAAVVDGNPLEARVLDATGQVLARGLVGTEGLLLESDFVSSLGLPGRIGATSIELGLAPVAGPRGNLR